MMGIRFAAATVGLLFGCTLAAHADATLRYKFKEGEKLTYKTEQKASMKTAAGGQDFNIDFVQSYDQVIVIGAVDKDGNGKFTCKFDNLKFVMDAPAPLGKIEYDAKAGKKPEGQLGEAMTPIFDALSSGEFTGTMSSTGEVKDVKIPEKLAKALKAAGDGNPFGDMFNEDSIKTLLNQSMATLPKDAIAKGKTWNDKMELKIQGGKMKVDNEYTYVGPTKKDGKEVEEITLKPKMNFEADPNAQTKMKVKEQSAKGTIYFDNTAGRILESVTEQTMDMEVELFGQALSQKIKQTTTSKLVK